MLAECQDDSDLCPRFVGFTLGEQAAREPIAGAQHQKVVRTQFARDLVGEAPEFRGKAGYATRSNAPYARAW
jgi:hypothetical protein